MGGMGYGVRKCFSVPYGIGYTDCIGAAYSGYGYPAYACRGGDGANSIVVVGHCQGGFMGHETLSCGVICGACGSSG